MYSPAILVVDDDASSRVMLALSLRQAGLAVDTAAGGDEALDMLRRRRYRWLLTDGRMSPMDGFRLAREAKRLQPGLHIIMISAIYTQRDAEARGAMIERFLPKPVAVDQLVRWIGA